MRRRYEIHNFCCSHRCTSSATLVRGALVYKHPRVPLLRLGVALSLSASALPVPLRFVSFCLCQVFLRPDTNTHLTQRLHRRRGNPTFPDPSVKRVRCNTEEFRDLNRRIRRRIQISGTLPVIVKKKESRKSAAPPGHGRVSHLMGMRRRGRRGPAAAQRR